MKHARIVIRIMLLLSLTFALTQAALGTVADRQAGYHDGCRSARGHYTRSAYKYSHSKRYHRGWRQGRRACARKTKVRHPHHASRKIRYRSCNSAVPWKAFQRGWYHGNRSARGHFHVDHGGCAAYRQGWVNGYRDCHCGDRKNPHNYAEGYYAGCMSIYSVPIRDDYYYQNYSGYRNGWRQGYQDCRSVYR